MVMTGSGALTWSAIQTEYNAVARLVGSGNTNSGNWSAGGAGSLDNRVSGNYLNTRYFTAANYATGGALFPTSSLVSNSFYNTSPNDEWNCACVCGMK